MRRLLALLTLWGLTIAESLFESISAPSHLRMLAETSSSVIKKTSYPVNKWTLVKRYPDEFKLKGASIVSYESKLIIFGGCKEDLTCSNSIYAFDIDQEKLEEIGAVGDKPSPRQGHCVISYGEEMVIFGGSNEIGVYDDMYIFDMKYFYWKRIEPKGVNPGPRSYHGCVLDQNQRIITFGGYTGLDYTNTVYSYQLMTNTWRTHILSGDAPSPRSSFSMTFINNQTWIFGGFTQGNIMNDLYVLDMEGVKWIKAGIVGEVPSPREYHVGIPLGQKLFIIGGCDYRKNICYNEVWEFNIKFMSWQKLDQDYDNLISRGSSAINGDTIYFYGACLLNVRCETNLMVFNTSLGCPTNCSGHGSCLNDKCRCINSYFDNECSRVMKCFTPCNDKSYCTSVGTCKCYPGYTGEDCKSLVNCPSNCTSSAHGICNEDGTCSCIKPWNGPACNINGSSTQDSPANKLMTDSRLNLQMFGYLFYPQLFTEVGSEYFSRFEPINNCLQNCNSRGFCKDGKCYCKQGYVGNSCSFTYTDYQNTSEARNDQRSKLVLYGSISAAAGFLLGFIFTIRLFWGYKKRES